MERTWADKMFAVVQQCDGWAEQVLDFMGACTDADDMRDGCHIYSALHNAKASLGSAQACMRRIEGRQHGRRDEG